MACVVVVVVVVNTTPIWLGFPATLGNSQQNIKNTIKHQTLKTSLNRAAFRYLLKVRQLFISLTSAGRAFHRAGATTEKALCLVPCNLTCRREGTTEKAVRVGPQCPGRTMGVEMLLQVYWAKAI